MIKHKSIIWGALAAILILLLSLMFYYHNVKSANLQKNDTKYVYSNTPTLYIHGFGGGPGSSNHMIAAVEKSNAGKKVFTATVQADGQVTLQGKWDNQQVNPLVQVLFKNNRSHNEADGPRWIKSVVILLQKKYHIKAFNIVAHSRGTVNTIDYLYDYGQDTKLPKLQKYVSMAGIYNGLRGFGGNNISNSPLSKTGKPETMSPEFKKLTKLRTDLPTNLAILNIYGNLEDGSHSDGRVQNNSSKALKYLVSPRAKSYQELEFKGKKAQHSQLHENAAVDRAIIKFLFSK
ncbi:hypothetical protein FC83_GL002685 [Agrilactobacillus composti DSM 18527 = JCM 14202]|uniref:Alpha/beta hydrolase n=1 Tax=Agrilactobacillus composti DSM 18527 = JCM 14202 TaxID=1423734 RepID=X0PIP9_9LACO|nr:alpha/beta hydrolase [Agrilactobacillus composti]KRM33665.1 hypothetical protein FC83_GL002685 [Agrilactobacillus composti DSM 18527 = JCM 14202]GAF41978.1 cell surface hydrolase [Agrilactobacillus composti DSM 18527 = JCM 14202]